MIRNRTFTYVLLAGAVVLAAALLIGPSLSADGTTVAALAEDTHFHGVAVDPRDPNRLYLATHHGVFLVGQDGAAERVSETEDDFMGFTPGPTGDALYASGHPSGGGNLGFIKSDDGGKTWSKLADGVGGPVDFHQMDVSKADPKVIYGVHGELQRSTDGGRSWSRVAVAPDGLIDLAASAMDVDRLYAATQKGLLMSVDGGRSWQRAHGSRQPATMVHVTADGTVYAYAVDRGLLRAAEGNLGWTQLGGGPGRDIVLHLAVGKGEKAPLYAVTFDPEDRSQSLRVSRDGGTSWSALGKR